MPVGGTLYNTACWTEGILLRLMLMLLEQVGGGGGRIPGSCCQGVVSRWPTYPTHCRQLRDDHHDDRDDNHGDDHHDADSIYLRNECLRYSFRKYSVAHHNPSVGHLHRMVKMIMAMVGKSVKNSTERKLMRRNSTDANV